MTENVAGLPRQQMTIIGVHSIRVGSVEEGRGSGRRKGGEGMNLNQCMRIRTVEERCAGAKSTIEDSR